MLTLRNLNRRVHEMEFKLIRLSSLEERLEMCLSGICAVTRARNSNASNVSAPAVGPSVLSDQYLTRLTRPPFLASYSSRWSATGFRAQ